MNAPKNAAVEPLNAVNLKASLWNTLQQLRAGNITPGAGDAIASQAREILRTVKTQLQIFTQSGKSVTNELIDFAKPAKD